MDSVELLSLDLQTLPLALDELLSRFRRLAVSVVRYRILGADLRGLCVSLPLVNSFDCLKIRIEKLN